MWVGSAHSYLWPSSPSFWKQTPFSLAHKHSGVPENITFYPLDLTSQGTPHHPIGISLISFLPGFLDARGQSQENTSLSFLPRPVTRWTAPQLFKAEVRAR